MPKVIVEAAPSWFAYFWMSLPLWLARFGK